MPSGPHVVCCSAPARNSGAPNAARRPLPSQDWHAAPQLCAGFEECGIYLRCGGHRWRFAASARPGSPCWLRLKWESRAGCFPIYSDLDLFGVLSSDSGPLRLCLCCVGVTGGLLFPVFTCFHPAVVFVQCSLSSHLSPPWLMCQAMAVDSSAHTHKHTHTLVPREEMDGASTYFHVYLSLK